MMTTVRLAVALTLPLSACAVDADDGPCIGMRRLTSNSLLPNRLMGNKLATNRLANNGLLDQELSTGALRADGVAAEMLRDPATRDVFAYAVQCALSPEQVVELTVDGEVARFEGALGLAPEWGDEDGSCDDECRGWVSSCLIARVNAKGESVVISLRGEHPGLLPTADELATYDQVEATYFGDVFAEPKRLHACLPDGATAIPRVCGESGRDCIVQIAGACSDVCDGSTCLAADGTAFTQTITVQRDTAACG